MNIETSYYMSIKDNHNATDDKITEVLKRYKDEQAAFENHWLWKKLNTTPQAFFKKVNEYVENSGIDKQVWQQKLSDAKKSIEVRLNEKQGKYKTVNFKNMTGIKI